MAKAHTGHLTGSDAVISAVFRQYGVTRVDGLDELLETSAAVRPHASAAAAAEPRRLRLRDLRRHRRAHGRPGRRRRAAAAAAHRRRRRRALHDGLIPALPAGLEPGRLRRPAGRPTSAAARSSTRIVADPNVDIARRARSPARSTSYERAVRPRPRRRRRDDRQADLRRVGLAARHRRHVLPRRLLDGGLPGVPHVRQLRAARCGPTSTTARFARRLPLAVRRRARRAPLPAARGAAHARDGRARRARCPSTTSKQLLRGVRHPGHDATCCATTRRRPRCRRPRRSATRS